jgi:hypothetical protein
VADRPLNWTPAEDNGRDGAVRVLLGNSAVVEKHFPGNVGVDVDRPTAGLRALSDRYPDGVEAVSRGDGWVTVPRGDLGNRVTMLGVPRLSSPGPAEVRQAAARGADLGLLRATRASDVVAVVREAWPFHSDADGPEWVECDEESWARAIADEFTVGEHSCVVGRPKGWKDDGAVLAGGAVDLDVLWGDVADPFDLVLSPWERLRARELMVNGGRDALMRLGYDTTRTGLSTGFSYMGVSANTSAAVATNTTLPGEITTAGGGLLRKQGVYGHSAGTSTVTISATFTGNGSDAYSVVLAKIGLFDAVTSGTLGHEQLLATTATLSQSGDSVAITYTGTWTPS